MSNTVTIELCAEDRARLDRILAALERSIPNAMTGLPEKQPEPEFLFGKVHAPAQEEPAEKPKQEDKPTITLAALQALVQELAAPGTGKFERVKKIVKQYAPKVGLIPEKDWETCHAELLALKKEEA